MKYGIIGRFKPLHNETAGLLESVLEQGHDLRIVIGSSNQYDARNPFTADETNEMIELFLKGKNYSAAFLPDFGNEPKWASEAKEVLGTVDGLITNNDYVSGLLEPHYKIIPSKQFSPDRSHYFSGSDVRLKMVRGENWKSFVPDAVADYLEGRGILARFIREFGEQTITLYGNDNFADRSREREKARIDASFRK
ncbi:MAG: hypothetical protein AABX51_00935 [Nanoarchaeota archaeon]